jgi:hypothetical protein
MKTKAGIKNVTDKDELLERLDVAIRLLEDLYILQALSIGVSRDGICGVLGVHTSRVSTINKGVKRALKNEKHEA